MTRVLAWCTRALSWALFALLIIASAAWCVAALAISGPGGEAVRHAIAAVAAAVALVTLIALPLRRWRWRAFGAYLVLFAVVLGWCLSLRAVERSRLGGRERAAGVCHDRRQPRHGAQRPQLHLSQRNRLHARPTTTSTST